MTVPSPHRAPRGRLALLLLVVALLCACSRETDPLRVAVAANFARPAEAIVRAFEAETGHRATLSSGSTGKLYAQITNGAPFHVFLSADVERPLRLEREGATVKGSRFTYARGRLALCGAALEGGRSGVEVLRAGVFAHLSIANPEAAPYGVAALQVLERLGVASAVSKKLVRGENVAQTFQFVETGAAEVGLVALSSARAAEAPHWVVPEALHQPLEQQVVLLAAARGRRDARSFMAFLRGPAARALVELAGYAAPPS